MGSIISQIKIGDTTYDIGVKPANIGHYTSSNAYDQAPRLGYSKLATTSFSWPANAITRKVWNSGMEGMEGIGGFIGIISISLSSQKLSLNSFGIQGNYSLVFSILNNTTSALSSNIAFRVLYPIYPELLGVDSSLLNSLIVPGPEYVSNMPTGAGWAS